MTKEEILKENGIEFSEYRIAYIYVAQGNVESAMDSYATAQTAELQKDNDRLKGIILRMWNQYVKTELNTSPAVAAAEYNKFKSDNNL